METAIATLAAAGALGFTADLTRDALRRPRPHVIAYSVGMAMFAVATLALAGSLVWGWSVALYKLFFLFGAVLNIPFLALGSVYLVVGRGAGRFLLAVLAVFSLFSVLVVAPAAVGSLPASGIPRASETFTSSWLALLAAVGGGVGATLLIGLAVVSIVRFWKTNRRLVGGNLLIVGGVLAASYRGTALAAVGEEGGFSLALLLAALLIWAGYRVASGQRRGSSSQGGAP